jgi:hypothetical protein
MGYQDIHRLYFQEKYLSVQTCPIGFGLQLDKQGLISPKNPILRKIKKEEEEKYSIILDDDEEEEKQVELKLEEKLVEMKVKLEEKQEVKQEEKPKN